MKTIVSGVQPTGRLHLGNYFGAVKQHIDMQSEGQCFYFVADYHALTTVQNPAVLRQNVEEIAKDYLALGLDHARDDVAFFRQSDVPQTTELAWIFATLTGMGLLERCVSYKDKVAAGVVPSVGLFTYPLLMAADILLYRARTVPVGADQTQHLQIARDVAAKFNKAYGPVFPLPEASVGTAKVIGTDGRKMSKSYDNVIPIFAEGKGLKKLIDGIKTDCKGISEPKDAETCQLFALYSLFANTEETASMRRAYASGIGYGEVKKTLLSKIDSVLGPAREKRKLVTSEHAHSVLKAGAERARLAAEGTMKVVRDVTGLG